MLSLDCFLFSCYKEWGFAIWLVLWENHPLLGWKQGSTHPCVTMIMLSASFHADVFWLPNEFLLLLTPNIHAYLNNSTKLQGNLYGKITLFFNPEEGDFLTTCVICFQTFTDVSSQKIRPGGNIFWIFHHVFKHLDKAALVPVCIELVDGV